MKQILIIALSCFSLSLSAQSLSLKEYKSEVKRVDEYLQMSQEGIKIAKANRQNAHKPMLPQLDLEGNYALDFNSLSPVSGYNPHNYGAQLVLSQVVYSGGVVGAQYKMAKLQEQQADYSLKETEDQLFQQAEKFYWSASANHDFLKATRRYAEIIKDLHRMIQDRFDNGAASKADLVMIQTRMKEAEGGIIQTQQSYTLALQQLFMLMGKDTISPSIGLESVLSTPEALVPVDNKEVLNKRPEYQKALLDVDIQKQAKSAAVSKMNPQVYVGAKGGYATLAPNFTGEPKLNGSAYVSLKVPIFHWNERGAINAASRSAIVTKELQLQRLEREITLEINQASTSCSETIKQARTAEENLRLAQENLDLVTFSYTQGKLPIVDVLNAQISWIQANNNLISANLSHKIAIADYKKAINGFNIE